MEIEKDILINDVEDYDNDYDNDTDKSHRVLKINIKYTIVGFICCFFIIGLFITLSSMLATIITLSVNCKNEEPEKTYIYPKTEQIIANTTEYQLDLFEDEWIDREDTIDIWMSYFAKHCKYYIPDEVSVNTDIRTQFYIDMSGEDSCNSKTEIRVREHPYEEYNSLNTIDIKKSSSHLEKASNFTFWPNDIYYNNASQKCEKDVHECFVKYSRETRIFYENPKTYERCIDIVELYPYAFSDLPIENLWNPVSIKSDIDYWYVREYEGYFNDSTKFKISFTLKYSSESRVFTESHHPDSGEWSIRIYSLNNGETNIYDNDVVSEVEDVWNKLILKFGNNNDDNRKCEEDEDEEDD